MFYIKREIRHSRSGAKTLNKCTKKCDALAKLLLCLLNLLSFQTLVAIASLDLKVPNVFCKTS